MDQTNYSLDFFLGTTTAAGFTGYFSQLGQEDGRQLYLIKGGPGCGKSTLMRRLADRAPEPVQRIHCASDPASLDGVVFCDQGVAFLDATAPHAMEPYAPGADEIVVNLYDTMDPTALRPHKQEIRALLDQNRLLRRKAARYVASAGSLLLDNRRTAACCTDFSKLRNYISGLANRLLPKSKTRACEQIRLLTGITPEGMLFYRDTVTALAERIYVFQDEHGAAARLAMELLRAEALARGCSVITCRCAMHPEDKIDHMILPGLGLAFLTGNSWHSCRFPGQKNIHCSRFMDLNHLRRSRTRMRFNRKAAAELLQQAQEQMRQAKQIHDELEKYYRDAVDFDAVNKICDQYADRLELYPKA